MTPIFHYLSQIERALKAGNSTEHTHRPALKELIEALAVGVDATNEPQRIECGSPDFIVTRKGIPLGYIEAKDVGTDLPRVEDSEQLQRYRASLRNLVLTDYLEFRLYRNGEPVAAARIGQCQKNGSLKRDPEGILKAEKLLQCFFDTAVSTIAKPRELAERMARIARLLYDLIQQVFSHEGTYGDLHGQYDAFKKVLIADLSINQFADMYAQTIAYGLFAARCNHVGSGFTRYHAGQELPKTNPFLRKLFNTIAGADLDDRIAWVADDLAELLARADIVAVLEDFGRATQQIDPIVHFYETFLAAYDPKMREARGVYYTPEPVVSYIVRSVDAILKKDFKLSDGLADASKIKLTRSKQHGKGNETIETHKVQILDPATGTGTFLYNVIGQIHESFANNKGMWAGYVQKNLLPRLYGFELLMAPYAVAHMKLGLLLRETGYDFSTEERLRVFLTNTLEEANELTGLPLFTQWLAEEANSANQIKKEAPVMVVIGNPPYSGHSANTGEWISGLLRGMDSSTGKKTGNYFELDGQPLGERNPKWLNDDYVKFIRFAQWRIEQTGYGVLGFVTNHGYLDNPTFRGMRQSLMQTFDDIYILDLHGNSKKKEKAPDGGKDENVFDIQQGVAIGLFVKNGKNKDDVANVKHADLYGLREGKYKALAENDLSTTRWEKLKPQAPFCLFVPQDETLRTEYQQGWQITEVMPVNVLGFQTHRDNFAIDFEQERLRKRIASMRHTDLNDLEFAQQYDLKDSGGWNLTKARDQLRRDSKWDEKLIQCAYRPFDNRWCYFSEVAMDRPRRELKENVSGKVTICFAISRQQSTIGFRHCLVSVFPPNDCYVSNISRESNQVFPLYLYPTEVRGLFDDVSSARDGRRPNLAPQFISNFSIKLKLKFIPDGVGDLQQTFGPEDVFHYAYSVFYSPTYRNRYADFLKIDFPRLPLTSDVELFRNLCVLGKRLVTLHLMEETPEPQVRYPVAGDNLIENVSYIGASGDSSGRVNINGKQFFDNVPLEVWNYHIGGYQVCQKWLKDRKGRQLSYDDLTHYRRIVAALDETIRIQESIDATIPEWPLL